jgi:hypothetical protein
MKTSQRIVLFCGLLLMLTALAASAAPFVSPKGYSFTPAPGWQVSRDYPKTDIAVLGPVYGKFRPNLNVTITQAEPGETLEEGQKAIAHIYPRIFTGFQMISSTIVKGHPDTLNVTCRCRQIGQMLRMRQMVVLKANHVYTFTCIAPEAAHARYEAEFAQMLNSVKWSK